MALFECLDASVSKTFVIELINAARIDEARKIIDGKLKKGVRGTVVPEAASYNRPWSWHLEPATISFFEMATEVCDCNVQYLEDHLSEIGGAFLPHNNWCPWSSRLVREV
jgi:hypothetical protein